RWRARLAAAGSPRRGVLGVAVHPCTCPRLPRPSNAGMPSVPPIPVELWNQITPAAQSAFLALIQQYDHRLQAFSSRPLTFLTPPPTPPPTPPAPPPPPPAGQNAARRVCPRAAGVLPRGRLRAVVEYIEGHLDAGPTLGQMAAVARRSPYHFARQ